MLWGYEIRKKQKENKEMQMIGWIDYRRDDGDGFKGRDHDQVALTFSFLVLDLPSTEMLSFLQHYDLRCFVVTILIFAPRVIGRTLRDGRPTGNWRSTRPIVLEFRVLVAIFVWRTGNAALKLTQECGRVLTVREAGGELVFRWLFRSHQRRQASGNSSGRLK